MVATVFSSIAAISSASWKSDDLRGFGVLGQADELEVLDHLDALDEPEEFRSAGNSKLAQKSRNSRIALYSRTT